MKRTWIVRLSFIGIVLVLLFIACQPTQRGYINSFERFIERVEENASSYSKEQWEKNDQQFGKFVERYKVEKQRLSSEENKQVGRLMARYTKAKLGPGNLFVVTKEMRRWFECVKGFGEEIKDYQSIKQGFIDEIQESLKEFPMLKRFFDELEIDIENY